MIGLEPMHQGHSLLAPSRAHRWVECPGSIIAELSCATEEQEETEFAKEGVEAHALAASFLVQSTRGLLPEDWPSLAKPEHPKEMVKAAYDYTFRLSKIMQVYRIFGGENMGIERRLQIPSIHPTMAGTPDFFVYSKEYNQLIIDDLKYGYRVIEPVDNYQLICYAAGVNDLLKCFTDDTKIQLAIYQPRAPHKLGPRRMWKTTWGGLQPAIKLLQWSADNAMSARPQMATGSHCRFCNARYCCETLGLESLSATEYNETPLPVNFDSRALAVELNLLERAHKMIGYRLDAIKQQVISRLKNGEIIPGYSLSESRGRTIWSLPESQVIEILGDGVRKGVMTPKQAIDAGYGDLLVDSLSEKKPGSMALKKSTTTFAKMIFGDYENGN